MKINLLAKQDSKFLKKDKNLFLIDESTIKKSNTNKITKTSQTDDDYNIKEDLKDLNEYEIPDTGSDMPNWVYDLSIETIFNEWGLSKEGRISMLENAPYALEEGGDDSLSLYWNKLPRFLRDEIASLYRLNHPEKENLKDMNILDKSMDYYNFKDDDDKDDDDKDDGLGEPALSSSLKSVKVLKFSELDRLIKTKRISSLSNDQKDYLREYFKRMYGNEKIANALVKNY